MDTPSQTLHRLTSYEPGREWDEPLDDQRIVQDLVTNDLARLPWFYKRYDENLPRIELPSELPSTEGDAVRVLAGALQPDHSEPDLAHLARLLFLSAGVVRKTERPFGEFLFRASGSAGGRFPLEVYVAVPEGGSLPPGVHWYHPLDHALVTIAPPPVSGSPTLVVTGVPWRTGWRYRERGFRHIYWDAGTMLSQTLALADSAGLGGALYTTFPDRSVERMVGADGVHEWPVALVTLRAGDPAVEGSRAAEAGEIDADPLEFPLVTEAQRAGDGDSLGAPWSPGPPARVELEGTKAVEEVILTRGSQRRMDPSSGLSAALLDTAMTIAMRGIDVPHWVVVHDVSDIEPGLYRWPDLGHPIRSGSMREDLYRISLEQGLARDAAFVVISATNVGGLDDRGYRDAQLAAGLVEGRLHLLAYSLGASASGMTFLDSEIAELLGEPLDGLLFTCVGVPEYTSAPGGTPGRPTQVKTVTPRT